MNYQQIFDIVAEHLLLQNATAINSSAGGCKYRDNTGHKCAIGALIPDDEYHSNLEGAGIAKNPEIQNILCRYYDFDYSEEETFFLKKLQQIHDFSPPKDWPYELKHLANCYGLTSSVVDKFRKK